MVEKNNIQDIEKENVKNQQSEEQKAEENKATSEEEKIEETVDLTSLLQEKEDLKDKLLRTVADLENTRKRHAKELDETRKYAASSFAKEMLSVQDNMLRALESLEKIESEDEHVAGTLEGIKMVAGQLESAFKQTGIEKVESLGEKLNPDFHQAMTQIDSEKESGTIVEVFQDGYTMHGRLLRPALVVVAK